MHICKKTCQICSLKDNLTQQICDDQFLIFKNIYIIPEEFRTQEMWNEYFNKSLQIKNVPTKFQTQEMWNEYFNKNKNIYEVPIKYHTNEMLQNHIKLQIDDDTINKIYEDYFDYMTGDKSQILKNIPLEYQQKYMYK